MFALEPGSLTDVHMRAARLVLQQYDAILLLSSTPEDMARGFAFALGWALDVHARNDRRSATLRSPVAWRTFMPADIGAARAMQAVDAQVCAARGLWAAPGRATFAPL